MMESLVLVVFAYILGSISPGYLLGKRAGVDVRQQGSGNIGATNVARALGKWQGGLTLLADAAKGIIPVALALQLRLPSETLALVASAAFLGHLYPIFLNFQGGKGVATALGALLVISPLAALVLIALFALTAFATRLVSLSSIVAAVLAPLLLWLFAQPRAVTFMGAFLGAMIVWRHRGNIQRLLAGTEPRFGSD